MACRISRKPRITRTELAREILRYQAYRRAALAAGDEGGVARTQAYISALRGMERYASKEAT